MNSKIHTSQKSAFKFPCKNSENLTNAVHLNSVPVVHLWSHQIPHQCPLMMRDNQSKFTIFYLKNVFCFKIFGPISPFTLAVPAFCGTEELGR